MVEKSKMKKKKIHDKHIFERLWIKKLGSPNVPFETTFLQITTLIDGQ